ETGTQPRRPAALRARGVNRGPPEPAVHGQRIRTWPGRARPASRALVTEVGYRDGRGLRWRSSVSGVFISYRGEDSDTAAVLIDRELSARLGSDRVFLDSRSIPAGVDFEKELLGRLRACSVLLVVIGPRWLSLADAAGRRRIDDPRDWIRREIVEALTGGLRVVPVLTGDAGLPAQADLPQDIAGLSRRQYVPLRCRYTSVDLAFLVERITEADPELAGIAARRQSTRRVPRQFPRRQRPVARPKSTPGWARQPTIARLTRSG